jgi:elongation factor P
MASSILKRIIIQFFNGRAISVDLPTYADLVIVETDPGIKGDTASGGSKPAKLETGVIVQVPLFVQTGDKIRVDTRTNEYLSRV